MSETTKTETSTATNTITYFFWISGEFARKLDEPKREYFENGYKVSEFETGSGFIGETVELSADETVTRIALMNYAMTRLLNSQNKGRTQRGLSLMFEIGDLHVKAFDCGRNEL